MLLSNSVGEEYNYDIWLDILQSLSFHSKLLLYFLQA